jgi:hypothetical protein
LGGSIVALKKNVYVIWGEDNLDKDEILYRMSTDGGVTFGPVKNLSGDEQNVQFPSISVAGRNVYVAWSNFVSNNNWEIFYRMSTDGGVTFGPVRNLSNSDNFSYGPVIFAEGNNVYIAWEEEVFSTPEIYFRSSVNGGDTFGLTKNLSNSPGYSCCIALAAIEGSVYVSWADASTLNYELMFIGSDNQGADFGASTNLSKNKEGASFTPTISVSKNIA